LAITSMPVAVMGELPGLRVRLSGLEKAK